LEDDEMTSIYRALAELEEQGKAGALCTIIKSRGSVPRHTGSKMLVYDDGHIIGTVGGGEVESRVIKEALAAIAEGKNRLLSYNMVNPNQGDPGICGGQLEVYVEAIRSQPLLVVIGGGHVGIAVSHLASWLGFRVVVSDDRPEWCTPELHPDADELYAVPVEDLLTKIHITPDTYFVLTTRGIDLDARVIPKLLQTSAAYIGIIGSKRRWITTRKRIMAETDLTETHLDKIHSPIGLELNAETPEEIAVSIMAEIMLLRKGGTGKNMKL
jgi:xanthine dehydrogenase accessory factor